MPAPFLDLLSLLNLLGLVQGLFLGITFLTSRKGNRQANLFIGMLLLCILPSLFEIFLCYTNYIRYFPYLVNAAEPFDFAQPALAYLYCLSLLFPHFRLQRKHLWHAVLPLSYTVFMVPYYLQSNAFKLHVVLEDHLRPHTITDKIQPILWFPDFFRDTLEVDLLDAACSLFYGYLIVTAIYTYLKEQKQTLFTLSNPAVKWLIRMLLYFSVVDLFSYALSFTSEGDLGDIYISTAISAIFYGLSFYLISHSRTLEQSHTEPAKKKYEKSVLDLAIAEAAMPKLVQYMETEKPYLDSNLSLAQLANAVSLSTHHLSQLLNERQNQNFFDFVNQYRIEEIKRKLLHPAFAHVKIEEIAFETGFNSKSAFNTAFKKFTGTTPSEYRKQSVTGV
jgi:AraC-like DNA-binding protein